MGGGAYVKIKISLRIEFGRISICLVIMCFIATVWADLGSYDGRFGNLCINLIKIRSLLRSKILIVAVNQNSDSRCKSEF